MAEDPEVEPVEEEEVEEEEEGPRGKRGGRRTVRVKRGEVWVLNVQTGEVRKASSETVEYDPITHMIFIVYLGKRTLRVKLIKAPKELDKTEAFKRALRAIQLV
jgi:hypothetical protein